ncbi:hypothetical protein CC80DRAFT_490458 [Byssothecium circinans]|uniref:Uncharacterized protein n=1 Tax=Byssothecium circinans TaxID=147558 RepID=A0A6A5U1V6_9PLEO|nr:hypothetical protein CC80DRAFT_490458 [Byssothecium circinans]
MLSTTPTLTSPSSPLSGRLPNQVHASLQAARNGALIVNYMHHSYSLAYPNRDPTHLEHMNRQRVAS